MSFNEAIQEFTVLGDKLTEKYLGMHLLKVHVYFEQSEYDFWFN